MAPRNGSYDNLAKVASQWHPAMAPRNGSSNGTQNGSYNNLAKSLIHQWHPAMAPRNGSYDNLAKVASQWHPAMTSSNGTQERQLRQPRQKSDPSMAPSNGTQERQLRQPRQSCVPMAPSNGTQQWHPGTAAAMAPRNGSYDNLAKSLIHQSHSNGTQERQLQQPRQTSDPPMAPSNGTQERQLRQPRQKSDPPMAPSNDGTQEGQLRQPRQNCVPMAPSNGTQERQQQWHPETAATTTSPKLRPNGAQQWHPGTAAAMAPRNGSYDNLAQSLIPRPLVLEVRTPIAKAIGGKNISQRKNLPIECAQGDQPLRCPNSVF